MVVDAGSIGGGGIVEDGFGEVRAYTRAAAEASAKTLNSATGETWTRQKLVLSLDDRSGDTEEV